VTGVDLLGWLSSLVLLLTLGQQVRLQWRSRESRGVSTWLFVGQLAASIGFSVYSYLLENWVFLSTNLLLVANAGVGEWVTLRNRRYAKRAEPRSKDGSSGTGELSEV
jgi:MtN3 and saliva related transmembrane protein